MRILSIQPWYSGSHRAFQDQWQANSRHEWTLLTLPGRHWKWRMRHSPIWFARQVCDSFAADAFDAIFCTDFLNVAEFRGLLPADWRRVPMVLYFHENQFAYPNRNGSERDLHFAFSNFASCLAADQIWFNSAFNRDSFFAELRSTCQRWPDYQPTLEIETAWERSRVESPGISLPESQPAGTGRPTHIENSREPVRLLWAARWEHDKNPGLLLEILQECELRQIDFRISVVGETFRQIPPEFTTIAEQFAHRIDQWGFQDVTTYRNLLQSSHVFLSTADHEFFGIAAAEAIAAGNCPLLPDRLAYPELINSKPDNGRRELFLYDGTARDFASKLEYYCRNSNANTIRTPLDELIVELTGRLGWQTRARLMDDQIEGICVMPSPNG